MFKHSSVNWPGVSFHFHLQNKQSGQRERAEMAKRRYRVVFFVGHFLFSGRVRELYSHAIEPVQTILVTDCHLQIRTRSRRELGWRATMLSITAKRTLPRVFSTSVRAKHTLPDLPYDYNVLPLLLLSREFVLMSNLS